MDQCYLTATAARYIAMAMHLYSCLYVAIQIYWSPPPRPSPPQAWVSEVLIRHANNKTTQIATVATQKKTI